MLCNALHAEFMQLQTLLPHLDEVLLPELCCLLANSHLCMLRLQEWLPRNLHAILKSKSCLSSSKRFITLTEFMLITCVFAVHMHVWYPLLALPSNGPDCKVKRVTMHSATKRLIMIVPLCPAPCVSCRSLLRSAGGFVLGGAPVHAVPIDRLLPSTQEVWTQGRHSKTTAMAASLSSDCSTAD